MVICIVVWMWGDVSIILTFHLLPEVFDLHQAEAAVQLRTSQACPTTVVSVSIPAAVVESGEKTKVSTLPSEAGNNAALSLNGFKVPKMYYKRVIALYYQNMATTATKSEWIIFNWQLVTLCLLQTFLLTTLQAAGCKQRANPAVSWCLVQHWTTVDCWGRRGPPGAAADERKVWATHLRVERDV